jgi:hypothetical protein
MKFGKVCNSELHTFCFSRLLRGIVPFISYRAPYFHMVYFLIISKTVDAMSWLHRHYCGPEEIPVAFLRISCVDFPALPRLDNGFGSNRLCYDLLIS